MSQSNQTNLEKENASIKSISLIEGEFIIQEESAGELFQINGDYPMDKLPGVLCKGIQYYDLKNVGFINNTGMINLIDLLKSLLKKGVETQFVNVNDSIKTKIKTLGLDHILNCV
ncbi:MAG TPA: STAS domain-containing protein [Bacteroidia bacterium]|jgi:ABC-type transporter Mla MlaB component